jgi:hypothetical protein
VHYEDTEEEQKALRKLLMKYQETEANKKKQIYYRYGMTIYNWPLSKRGGLFKKLRNVAVPDNIEYKIRHAKLRKGTKKANRHSWDRNVANTEHNLHARQDYAYKTLNI